MTFLALAGRWIVANPLTASLIALCATLGTGLAWSHAVTIPLLERQASAAEDAKAKAIEALAGANAATAECNASQDALRAEVDRQSGQIAGLQVQAAAADKRAAAAGAAVVRQPLRPQPAGKTAADVNAYLQSLRSAP